MAPSPQNPEQMVDMHAAKCIIDLAHHTHLDVAQANVFIESLIYAWLYRIVDMFLFGVEQQTR